MENINEKDEIKKSSALEIEVDDGSEQVIIKNKHGEEIGVFYFSPTDIGIIERYNEFAKHFSEITAPLENINISSDGTATEDGIEDAALKAAENRLYKACDRLFNGNMSKAFFGSMHPFSPVNGAFYCEGVLSAVGKFIAQRFDTEVGKIQKRVGRYTSDYNKPRKK